MTTDLKVFVYGTLKPGGHYWPEFCEGKVLTQTPAKVHGLLYDLHVGYPGLRLGGDDWVLGYLYELKQAAHLERLDYLEGYVPHRPESQNDYQRLKAPCFDLEGNALGEAWIYEMSTAKIAQHNGTLIESGDWPIEPSSKKTL
jgi:gamma-glutamylcyclotransferase (GGCT)/AIG2-like uncharacterized protein YtfP